MNTKAEKHAAEQHAAEQHEQHAAEQHADDAKGLAGSWVELTDAATGRPWLIDMAAVTHIGPAMGSRRNHDPSKQASAGNEMALVTVIGTIGGLTITVLEEIEDIARDMRGDDRHHTA